MTFWLTTPLLWHEPPASVVQRLLISVRRAATRAERPDRLVGATHAGSLRALIAWAAGADLGEPDNAEDVQLAVHDDHVGVTFRGNRWHARFPGEPISWFPEAQGRPR
jgi:broad specificity phosphatase PhoE